MRILTILILGATLAIAFSSLPLQAADDYALRGETAELAQMIRKQQQQSEKEIVRLWLADNRGEPLSAELADYVARELRLRAITGTSRTGSLLADILGAKQPRFEDYQALARSIVMAHYRRLGVDLEGEHFVQGSYLLRPPATATGGEEAK